MSHYFQKSVLHSIECVMEEEVLRKLQSYQPQLTTLWQNNGIIIQAGTVNFISGGVVNLQQNFLSGGFLTPTPSLPCQHVENPAIACAGQGQSLAPAGPSSDGHRSQSLDSSSRTSRYKPGNAKPHSHTYCMELKVDCLIRV